MVMSFIWFQYRYNIPLTPGCVNITVKFDSEERTYGLFSLCGQKAQ